MAQVWDTSTGAQVLKLDRHTDIVQVALFNHDDTKIFTLGIDQYLVIWEVSLDN